MQYDRHVYTHDFYNRGFSFHEALEMLENDVDLLDNVETFLIFLPSNDSRETETVEDSCEEVWSS